MLDALLRFTLRKAAPILACAPTDFDKKRRAPLAIPASRPRNRLWPRPRDGVVMPQ